MSPEIMFYLVLFISPGGYFLYVCYQNSSFQFNDIVIEESNRNETDNLKVIDESQNDQTPDETLDENELEPKAKDELLLSEIYLFHATVITSLSFFFKSAFGRHSEYFSMPDVQIRYSPRQPACQPSSVVLKLACDAS